jgi:hypothetical protein
MVDEAVIAPGRRDIGFDNASFFLGRDSRCGFIAKRFGAGRGAAAVIIICLTDLGIDLEAAWPAALAGE